MRNFEFTRKIKISFAIMMLFFYKSSVKSILSQERKTFEIEISRTKENDLVYMKVINTHRFFNDKGIEVKAITVQDMERFKGEELFKELEQKVKEFSEKTFLKPWEDIETWHLSTSGNIENEDYDDYQGTLTLNASEHKLTKTDSSDAFLRDIITMVSNELVIEDDIGFPIED